MDDRYFRTTSFHLAAFLSAKGVELANIEKENPKRATFVFRDSPQREHLLESFNFGKEDAPEVMVDGRKLITAIKQLKEKLYQDDF